MLPENTTTASRLKSTQNRIETGIDDHTNTARYRVFTDVQSCTVTGLQGDATVSIYDVAGRQMLRRHTTANSLEGRLYPQGPTS